MKKFCPNCGAKLKEGLSFCPNCGTKIETSTDYQVTKQQIFCPNCNHVLKSGAEYCSHCGYDLKSKRKVDNSQTAVQTSNTTQTQKVTHQYKPISKKKKIIFSVVGILAALFVVFYIWGSSYYSESNQINRITSGLIDPNQNISKYVVADTTNMKVTDESLKPLQKYYQDHQTKATELNENLKEGISNSSIQLVRNGRYWILFPRYKLQVQTYQPQVSTNHGDSQVLINGKDIGRLSSVSDGQYNKKIALIFPGKYNIVVKSKVAGRNLTATSTANIWSNKTLNMDIATQTFSVKSVPNGEVYINDKKVATLDENGDANFKSYPITKNMELYVLYNANGKKLRSETVNGIGSAFGLFSDDNYEDSDAGEDITKNDDGYVIEPHWKGLISKDEAKNLLSYAFSSVDEDDFVDRSANKDYSDLKQQQKSWNDDDDIDDWDTDVDVEAVYPASDNSCTVIYKVNYSFDNGDSTKKQVMEFKGAVIQTDGDDSDNAKIKTIGKGKLISSKDFDD